MTEKDAAKMTQLLKAAMEELDTPLARERTVYTARAAWMQYGAYVGQGFTPEQAIQLVIAKL